jgi:hypothetical protein
VCTLAGAETRTIVRAGHEAIVNPMHNAMITTNTLCSCKELVERRKGEVYLIEIIYGRGIPHRRLNSKK